ncbi:E3 ubiquitin-protein ligase CHFR-like isoform X2 [Corticium candelabrum]|uniref:E3 ubiquitin-protein ligase CHFR-like isoform X2 n=1 Tax=Corticium candelabrum TaxID=121492 RepID=UPI002E2703EF|nr:E3 ubiquitin-protein ligase CHFR-like isoform X2 [Corticium candelabrum]
MLFCLLDVTYRFEVVQDQEQTLEMTQEYDEEEDDTSITKKIPKHNVPDPSNTVCCTDDAAVLDCTEPLAKVAHLEDQLIGNRVDAKNKSNPTKDDMEESLICGICKEILHNCVSLQPCMHAFCAGCYSMWMERSKDCPQCRGKVQRVSKNHIVNNLVDAYLKIHPEKKRSDDDLKELDAQNKITEEMMYPKTKRGWSDDEYHDSDEDSAEDSDTPLDSDDSSTAVAAVIPVSQPPPMKCRQCPGYSDTTVTSSVTASDSSSSSSAAVIAITAPPYTCNIPAIHIICHCCMQPMPNCAVVMPADRVVPEQKCDVCCQSYCHLYWGCNALNCRGCLGRFSEINLSDTHLNGILNKGNIYESDVLKDCLKAKGLTIRDVLKDCAAKLDNGEYQNIGATRVPLRSDTTICYRCCLTNFQQLVYFYRKDLPVEDLPIEVVSRPDCYWGKNCRTQYNKPHHARHFNHICEQTRF